MALDCSKTEGLLEAAQILIANSQKLTQWVNGTETEEVDLGGVTSPAIRNLLRQIKESVDETSHAFEELARAWAESDTPPDAENAESKSAKSWAEKAQAEADRAKSVVNETNLGAVINSITAETSARIAADSELQTTLSKLTVSDIGTLSFFSGNNPPEYLVPADGRLLSAEDFPNAFGQFGSSYGGDGVTTFALPDMRGAEPLYGGVWMANIGYATYAGKRYYSGSAALYPQSGLYPNKPVTA